MRAHAARYAFLVREGRRASVLTRARARTVAAGLSRDTPDMMATACGHHETANYLKSLDTTMKAVMFAGKMKKGGGEGGMGQAA